MRLFSTPWLKSWNAAATGYREDVGIMFTPQKILILLLILGFVWFLFRVIEKRNKVMNSSRKDQGETMDLTECSHCGKWVNSSCEKDNCPISG